MSEIVSKNGFEYRFDGSLCASCEGSCCIGESGYIWISKDEILALAEFLNLSLDEFGLNYLQKIGYKYSLKEVQLNENNYACVFFDLDKKQCSIYEYRPLQCRTFPFWEYFKQNKEELVKECKAVLY